MTWQKYRTYNACPECGQRKDERAEMCHKCRVKNRLPIKPLKERFWSKANKSDGCWEWTAGKNSRGYGWFKVYRRPHLAHRIAYELEYGPIPESLHVCHHCDNPACVRPDHLFLGTDNDNAKDRDNKGRLATFKGEKNGNAKLTAEQVLEIRSAVNVPSIELAKQYGTTNTNINRIRQRKLWKHI